MPMFPTLPSIGFCFMPYIYNQAVKILIRGHIITRFLCVLHSEMPITEIKLSKERASLMTQSVLHDTPETVHANVSQMPFPPHQMYARHCIGIKWRRSPAEQINIPIYSDHYSHFINENICAESSRHLYCKENGNVSVTMTQVLRS